MAWVYVFLALALMALVGIIADVAAIRLRERAGVAIASVALKGMVVLAYAGWGIFFGLIREAEAWEDLAAFAGILVLSVPVLVVALILDATLAVWLSNRRA